MPIAQHPGRGSLQEIVVRTSVAPAALIETVRQRIQRADPDVATKLTTYESHAADAVATPRFRMAGLVVCGARLLLAVAGVMRAAHVSHRAADAGARRPDGALARTGRSDRARAGPCGHHRRGRIADWRRPVAVASRALTTMVFGTEAVDPMTYVVVLGAVLIVTLAAAAVPAWRASRIDPLSVLREN